MKLFKSLILTFLVFSLSTISYSQRITAGFYSGVNFSDIHGNRYSGKWKNIPGPVQGLTFNYKLKGILGLGTGIDFSSVYYDHLNYINYPIDAYYSLSSVAPMPGIYIMPGIYYPYNERMDFNYLTLPAQITLTIPSKPSLSLSAGLYYSFLLDSYEPVNPFQNSINEDDYGYLYSAGLTYPISEKFNASFNIRYSTGRSESIAYGGYSTGATSYTLGLGYTGFLKSGRERNQKHESDSINEKIFLIYRGGLNASWNSGTYFPEKYSERFGVSLGMLINFRLSNTASFQTGLSYERFGFSLRDSSDFFHVFHADNKPDYYVDTRVSVDYILIPALLNISIGKQGRFYFNTGPYLALNLNGYCRGKAISEIRSRDTYVLNQQIVSDDLEEVIRDFDTGWIFGGGTTFVLFEKTKLDVGLRYITGFRDVYTNPYLDFHTGEPILKNSAVTLHIGLRLPVYRN